MALLPVQLTDAEKAAKAMELANTCDRIKSLEGQRRETTAEINVSIKAQKHILDKLTREVKSGQEERDVPTKEVHDWASNLVREIRVDTGEQIGSRVLTAAERQQPLAIEGKKTDRKRKAGGDDGEATTQE